MLNRESKITQKVYSSFAKKEWKRVIKDPFHKLEFDTTLYFLEKYLPKKGVILDAGGGPGRYTIELAKRGYHVVLLDLTKENLILAKKKIKIEKVNHNIKDIIQGTITDLSQFKDNTFDAVICLGGPLSHVAPEKNRIKAISELIRVAKKDSPIFISVMGRYGVINNALKSWPEEIALTKHWKRIVYKGDDYKWLGGKGYCHFFTGEELKDLFISKNIMFLNLIGLDGLANPNIEETNKLFKKNPKAWSNWIDMHYNICTKLSVADISQHMLIIGKKIK
jgi:2-polyprenyl-3-methyl-5-hydroxy-6-metoxy-1,4-benzoquinol methylase